MLQFCKIVYCTYYTADGWATDDLIYKWKDVDPVQVEQ